jgi:hypothetical protein
MIHIKLQVLAGSNFREPVVVTTVPEAVVAALSGEYSEFTLVEQLERALIEALRAPAAACAHTVVKEAGAAIARKAASWEPTDG